MSQNISAIVIDDDKDTVSVFKDYLSLKGIDVVGVGYNGKEAVQLYLKLKPDIVFLDHMMPEYDGLYALSNIKKINASANIVFITADESVEDNQDIIALGPTAILPKPFKIDQVMEVVQKITKTRVVK
jgi:two-component system, chemotaxis family, chemotaxis protein CheY